LYYLYIIVQYLWIIIEWIKKTCNIVKEKRCNCGRGCTSSWIINIRIIKGNKLNKCNSTYSTTFPNVYLNNKEEKYLGVLSLLRTRMSENTMSCLTKEFISKTTQIVIPACRESFFKKDCGQAAMTKKKWLCGLTYGLISNNHSLCIILAIGYIIVSN